MAWLRTTSFNLKNNIKNIKDNNIQFTFVTSSYRMFLAIEYDNLLLVIKEFGSIYSYNDLYKFFNWFEDKKYINVEPLEMAKHLIMNKHFDFSSEFNQFLVKAESFQCKIRIFE